MSDLTPERYEKTIGDLMQDLFKANCEAAKYQMLKLNAERYPYVQVSTAIAEVESAHGSSRT